MLFGYFDASFTHNSTTREVRMVYGNTGDYVRGDKLLKVGGVWKWYDTVGGTFTTTRPSSPSAVALVRDFSDPVRPNMVYYMLGATLSSPLTFSNQLIDNNTLNISVDFAFNNAVTFTNVTSEATYNALSDADLIQKFDMKQNVSNWSNPGITCNASMTSTPK
jgi:hypothetical protein